MNGEATRPCGQTERGRGQQTGNEFGGVSVCVNHVCRHLGIFEQRKNMIQLLFSMEALTAVCRRGCVAGTLERRLAKNCRQEMVAGTRLPGGGA